MAGRALDLVFAASALVGAVVAATDPTLPTAVRSVIAAIGVLVAWLFVRREQERSAIAPWDVAIAAPSLVLAALFQRFAAPVWSAASTVCFALFGAFTFVSLASLGRSFGVLPARRSLVSRGPYRWIRHPVYLGELGMTVTVAATHDALAGVGCALAMLLVLLPRIRREERALAADADYARYVARVRHRLVPGVY